MKPATHLNRLPRLRMRGAVPPLPNTSSCRGMWLSAGATFFTLNEFLESVEIAAVCL